MLEVINWVEKSKIKLSKYCSEKVWKKINLLDQICFRKKIFTVYRLTQPVATTYFEYLQTWYLKHLHDRNFRTKFGLWLFVCFAKENICHKVTSESYESCTGFANTSPESGPAVWLAPSTVMSSWLLMMLISKILKSINIHQKLFHFPSLAHNYYIFLWDLW